MDQRQLQIVLKLQDQATSELRKLSGEFDKAEKSSSSWGASLADVGQRAVKTSAAIGAAVIAAGTWGVSVAGQLETAQVGLATLLGSTEKAASTVARLKVEAARTPFELPGLTQAVQLLTSVTKDGDKSIDIILNIGEGLAAMGKGQAELDRIIVNLQQIAAVGHAATIDIKQFAFAGIPIYEMLSETTGKTGDALQELIENGGVTFDVLTKMFDKANDAGGRFFNAYKNQAGTFQQSMSNMKDAVGIFLSDFVKNTGIFDTVKVAIARVTDAFNQLGIWAKENPELAKFIGMVAASMAAMVPVAIALSVAATYLSGPVLAVVAAIALLGAGLIELYQNWDAVVSFIEEKTGIITMLKDTWQAIVDLFNDQLKPALLELWDTLQPYKPYLEALGQVIGFVLVLALKALILLVGQLAQALITALTWITKVADFIAGFFITALNALRDTIATVITWVQNLIDKFKEAWDWAGKVASKAGGFIGNAVNSVGNAIGSAANSVANVFRAGGGNVAGGQAYVVGERGPEMFVPRSSGTIIPNGAGGMSVNVVVNGDVTGRELVERVQEAIMSSLRSNMKLAL